MSLRLDLKFSEKEIRRRAFNFAIGVIACCITIFVAATVSTVIDIAPIVILKQTESNEGQYDIQITPRNAPYFNYTAIVDTLNERNLGSIARLSTPRYLFNDTQSLFFTTTCVQKYGGNLTHIVDKCELRFAQHHHECKSHLSSLWIIDFEQEKKIGFGARFPTNLIPHKGEVVVNWKLAVSFEIEVGDAMWLYLDLNNGAQQNLLSSLGVHGVTCSKALFAVSVAAIVDETAFGKFGSEANQFTFIMSSANFLPHVLEHNTHLNYTMVAQGDGDNHDHADELRELSTNIFFMLPDRLPTYLTLNYHYILQQTNYLSSQIAFAVGFPWTSITTPLILRFNALKYMSIFFQLVLNLMLFILMALSIMLLYSLLSISVDSRTFELSILRMIGMRTRHLVKMLLLQSCVIYSLPSWLIAVVLSEVAIFYLMHRLDTGYSIAPVISVNGLLRSVAVALVIPSVSILLPIKNALSKNLHDSIDGGGRASETTTLQASSSSTFKLKLTLIASIFIAFGVCVYYVFPLSLITQNLSLTLVCFIGLLCLMLVGLSMLTFTVVHMVQKCIILVLFSWWERPLRLTILVKNLRAHKRRNEKTYHLYSLSLAFILMIAIIYRVQIDSIALQLLATHGGKHFVKFDSLDSYLYIEHEFMPHIVQQMTFTYGWATPDLKATHTVFDFSKIYTQSVNLVPVAPNYLHVAESALFSAAPTSSPYLVDELYTAKGSQTAMLGHRVSTALHTQPSDRIILDLRHQDVDTGEAARLTMLSVLANVNVFPGNPAFGKFYEHSPDIAVSLPALLRYYDYANKNASMEDTMQSLLNGAILRFAESANESDVTKVKEYIFEYAEKSFDFDSFSKLQAQSNSIMNIVFFVSCAIALFLCLFSVISSMYVNIYEQSKEIAILRAIGIDKMSTYRIYLYEATVLILSSCLMGIFEGLVVGFTLSAQVQIYASYPITFNLGNTTRIVEFILIILLVSFASAFISIVVPLVQLLSKTVSQVMRFAVV